MTTSETGPEATTRVGVAKALALLALGLLPWPSDWTKVRDVVDNIRSPELNRAERENHAAGYYEGLISGRENAELSRGDASGRLIGNPSGCVDFKKADVVHYRDGEFLQFELLPSVERTLFGQPFVTNEFGMCDGPVSATKPANTFRIAVLGSSIDMGWGVTYRDTYIHQFEDWLNSHSARLGTQATRRFEVLNFGVAAYSPMQRLETLNRKVMPFHPDMVIFSATTNDIRLLEIHLCEMLRKRIDLKYDFLREVVSLAGLDQDDLRVGADGDLIHKASVKRKLQPLYWNLYDRTLGAIAAECRTAGLPLAMVIVPRVGKADVPATRAEPVARLSAIASHQGIAVFDLTDSFDLFEAGQIEITVGDDHPNVIGHRRLFRALARAVVKDEDVYRRLFTGGQHPEAQSPAVASPEPVQNSGKADGPEQSQHPGVEKAPATTTTMKCDQS